MLVSRSAGSPSPPPAGRRDPSPSASPEPEPFLQPPGSKVFLPFFFFKTLEKDNIHSSLSHYIKRAYVRYFLWKIIVFKVPDLLPKLLIRPSCLGCQALPALTPKAHQWKPRRGSSRGTKQGVADWWGGEERASWRRRHLLRSLLDEFMWAERCWCYQGPVVCGHDALSPLWLHQLAWVPTAPKSTPQ